MIKYIVSDRDGLFVKEALEWPVFNPSTIDIVPLKPGRLVMTGDLAQAMRFETFSIARVDNGLFFDPEDAPTFRVSANLQG